MLVCVSVCVSVRDQDGTNGGLVCSGKGDTVYFNVYKCVCVLVYVCVCVRLYICNSKRVSHTVSSAGCVCKRKLRLFQGDCGT